MSEDLTRQLLADLREGKRSAADELLVHVYDELRRIAGQRFGDQPSGHTLQPTALVHEAYLRLVGQTSVEWRDRSHFLAVASRAMRQILTDHFRRKNAEKRGGDWRKVTLSGVGLAEGHDQLDLGDLEEALLELEELDPRQGQLIELRFYGGLTVDETAEALSISKSTVEREWRFARAWLLDRLGGSPA